MAFENTVSIDFDPRSSIVDSVFDCRLPAVRMMLTVCAGPRRAEMDEALLRLIVPVGWR